MAKEAEKNCLLLIKGCKRDYKNCGYAGTYLHTNKYRQTYLKQTGNFYSQKDLERWRFYVGPKHFVCVLFCYVLIYFKGHNYEVSTFL